MSRQDARELRALDWFGADVEDHPEAKTTATEFHGYRGVDADVPRNVRQDDGTVATVMVRKPAPRYLRATTTGGARTDHDIARTTARFKMAREGFRFAPLDDKEMWERRMNIALAEMQIARFRQKLANYQAREENPRPEQVQLLKDTIRKWVGTFAELTGQG